MESDDELIRRMWYAYSSTGDRDDPMPAILAVVRAHDRDGVVADLKRAFSLGQTYWHQADSEYTSHHKKADETQAKFQTLVDETRAAILADLTPNA